MENRFKFFADKYNKILDLIASVDEKLANKYQDVMASLPNVVLNRLDTSDKFNCFGKDFQADLKFDGEMLEFDYTKLSKYFDVELRMYPLYEEEFSDEFDDEMEEELEMDLGEMNQWFIFSLRMSNVKGIAKLKIDYEEKAGELFFKNADINGVEIDYEVFIEKREEEYFVIITKYLNGYEIYQKEIPIAYDALLTYSSTWDDIEEESQQDAEYDF